ncbi:ABC transporter substrate-binding protein [Dehalogenimonas sp. THU2]|uniref:ABC transporter substrate-binding protein n=1 Tax=Dehalogenimonas sp. THU2 TaxID=3151121 RepID=UPI003218D7D1
MYKRERLAGRVFSIVLSLGLALSFLLSPVVAYTPPHSKPGPAADKLIFKAFNVDIAAAALAKGEMDMYIYSLKTLAAQDLATNQNIAMYQAPATSIGLVLNPAPAPDGQFNPFSIKTIRFALNQIIDRNYIAQQIYHGSALPMVSHLSSGDYDYRAINSMIYEMNLGYQPEQAKATIAAEMQKAGCTLVNNLWNYQGKPIELKFIVRTEDERRVVGDTIAAELTKLGFTARVVYQQFAQAINIVYSQDPGLLQWHLYTEGWSKGSADKYDAGLINQMYAPWLGNMPGWQEQGFWQYQNSQLDELGKKIYMGTFTSVSQRDDLYKQMTKLAMEDAVRLWVVTGINNFAAKSVMDGVTQDIAAGPRSIFTLREAYVPGQSTLTIGNQWVWTERSTWNPVGGFGDAYSSDIWRNMVDPPLINHPFTGLPVSYRASYSVETSGPAGTLSIPADAFRWDADKGRFASVGASAKATSKVVFDYSKYFQSKWHNGQQIEMADLVYAIYQSFDMVYNKNKSAIEFAAATTSKPVLDTFKGFRIIDANKIEVYVDYWHFVPDYIASYAVPASLSMPWEMLAAMDNLVFEKRQGAYSDTAAARFNVDWLSLVNNNHAIKVKNVLTGFINSSYVPNLIFDTPQTRVSFASAQARYQADIAFFNSYGNLAISNGPFKLVRFESGAQYAELEAFRDPGYPFKPGDKFLGTANLVDIKEVSSGKLEPGKTADISVELTGDGKLAVDYCLVDPSSNRVLKSGQAQGSGTKFSVNLSASDTQNLSKGIYHLYLLAYSDTVSLVTERRVDVDMAGGGIIAPPEQSNGTNDNGGGSGGISPILIVIPVALLVGSGLVMLIMKGAKPKKS